MTTPNPHTEGYRVTWVDATSTKITLSVVPSSSTSVPDDGGPVSSIVCKKDNTHADRTGIESPEDVTALIYLNTATFGSASATMHVGTVCSYQSNRIAGYENLSLFGWS